MSGDCLKDWYKQLDFVSPKSKLTQGSKAVDNLWKFVRQIKQPTATWMKQKIDWGIQQSTENLGGKSGKRGGFFEKLQYLIASCVYFGI